MLWACSTLFGWPKNLTTDASMSLGFPPDILTSRPTLTTIAELPALPVFTEEEGYCSMPKASRKLTQREIQNLWCIYQSVAPDLFKAVDESLGRPTRRRNSQKELLRQFNRIIERLEQDGIDDLPP